MIRIIDKGQECNSSFGSGSIVTLDRDIYRRLNTVPNKLIGDLPDDSRRPMSFFYEEMEKINSGNLSNTKAVEADEFLGSLGVTLEYPHKDREVFK